MIDLKGVICAIPTPLKDDETVDEKGLRRIIKYEIEGGVHGVFILGTMGEFANLDRKIKTKVIEIAVDEVKRRIPLLVGTGDTTTKMVIENTKIAKKAGADVAVVTPPFYYIYQQEEVLNFYRRIADVAEVPLVIYNSPLFTKNQIEIETVISLSKEEKIIGLKDSSCNFSRIMKLIRVFKGKDRFKIFQGDEHAIDAALLMGADGFVTGIGSLSPRLCVKLYEACRKKDIVTAQKLQVKFLNLYNICDNGMKTWLADIKTACELLGLGSGKVTEPFLPLTKQRVKSVAKTLRQIGLL